MIETTSGIIDPNFPVSSDIAMSCYRLQARFAVVFFSLFSALSLAVAPASAQVTGYGFPPGSYINSCNALSTDKENTTNQNLWVLHANCQNGQERSGKKEYVSASLKGALACQNGNLQIENSYGVLECLAPAGSYRQSCITLYVTYPNSGSIQLPGQASGDQSLTLIPTPGTELLTGWCKTNSGKLVQAFYWAAE